VGVAQPGDLHAVPEARRREGLPAGGVRCLLRARDPRPATERWPWCFTTTLYFEAETKRLIPLLTAFQERHAVSDIVVVADAGMLSAANLLALEEAWFAFHDVEDGALHREPVQGG
jgi:hypothetical protein